MNKLGRTSTIAALLVMQFSWIGCGTEAELESTEPSGGAVDDDLSASVAEGETDGPRELFPAQTIELAAGHSVTLWRFDDGSTALAEVGVIGEHEEKLSDTTVGLPLTKLVEELAPGTGIDAFFAPAGDQVERAESGEMPSLLVPDVGPVSTYSMTPSLSNAKSTNPTTSSGGLPFYYVTNTYLHCADTVSAQAADAPVRYCNSTTGTATTPAEMGGYFRTNATYTGNSGTATYSLYRQGIFNIWSLGAQVVLSPRQWGKMYYLSPTINNVYATISAPAGQGVSISSHSTEIAPRAQENPHWCWLASAQMAMARYANNREQCNMADLHWGRPSATEGECCRLWPTNASYVEGDPSCDGGGESCQALTENGMAWTFLDQSDVDDALVLEQALQNGPVIVHHPAGPHYSVLSDYKEFYENGAWVPYALRSDPWGPRDYNTAAHMSWVRLDQVGLNNPNGFIDFALADIRSTGSGLDTKIRRVSWNDNVATAHFYARGAQSYEYQFLDSGGATGDGAIWAQGTVAAPASGSAANCWKTYTAASSNASLNVGGWLWYAVKVRACANGSCGAWAYTRSVSRVPITTINSVSGATTGNLSIAVTAAAAPEDTVFRYRVANSAAARTYRTGTAKGTASRFSKTATITVPVPLGVNATVQVQACSLNGCSDWAQQTVHTGI